MTDYYDWRHAIELAFHFHLDQKRITGEPYIDHPLRVSLNIANADYFTRTVAVLHDILEDTECNKKILVERFGVKVANMVVLLTHKKGEDYIEDYIKRISKNKIATKIKLTDIMDNYHSLHQIPDRSKAERLRRKYLMVIDLLRQNITIKDIKSIKKKLGE